MSYSLDARGVELPAGTLFFSSTWCVAGEIAARRAELAAARADRTAAIAAMEKLDGFERANKAFGIAVLTSRREEREAAAHAAVTSRG